MALSPRSAPYVRSFAFDDHEQRVAGGSAVLVGSDPSASSTVPLAHPDPESESDDFSWSDAQTAAFLAADPLTLGWVTESPAKRGQERVYVCCWITIETD